jgi:hypothetical protein
MAWHIAMPERTEAAKILIAQANSVPETPMPTKMPIDEILRQYAVEFKNCPAAVTLFNQLQQQKEKYGNPTFTPLREAFDVTWDAGGTKIALRWTWCDPYNVRKNEEYDEKDSLLGCALIGDYKEHLLLKQEDNPCMFVNAGLRDYPGKIGPIPYPNEIVTCKTQEGIWLKAMLEDGLDFLSGLS